MWVTMQGNAMEKNIFTDNFTRVFKEFNSSLHVTPIEFRRIFVTQYMKKLHTSNANSPALAMKKVENLLNVHEFVMHKNYNRSSKTSLKFSETHNPSCQVWFWQIRICKNFWKLKQTSVLTLIFQIVY